MSARWKQFENQLKKTAIQYRIKKKAIIEYIEVPSTAYGAPKTSTVDFFGAYAPLGKGIAFDAKTTHNKTSFALKNIKTHQIEFLRYWKDIGADSYIFLQFCELQEIDKFYKIPLEFILDYWDTNKKSIKVTDINQDWITSTSDFL